MLLKILLFTDLRKRRKKGNQDKRNLVEFCCVFLSLKMNRIDLFIWVRLRFVFICPIDVQSLLFLSSIIHLRLSFIDKNVSFFIFIIKTKRRSIFHRKRKKIHFEGKIFFRISNWFFSLLMNHQRKSFHCRRRVVVLLFLHHPITLARLRRLFPSGRFDSSWWRNFPRNKFKDFFCFAFLENLSLKLFESMATARPNYYCHKCQRHIGHVTVSKIFLRSRFVVRFFLKFIFKYIFDRLELRMSNL